jgi:hypothetical protein
VSTSDKTMMWDEVADIGVLAAAGRKAALADLEGDG